MNGLVRLVRSEKGTYHRASVNWDSLCSKAPYHPNRVTYGAPSLCRCGRCHQIAAGALGASFKESAHGG